MPFLYGFLLLFIEFLVAIFSTFQAYYIVYKISLSSRVVLTQSFILLLQRGYIVLSSYGITVGSWDFCLLDWIPCLYLFKFDSVLFVCFARVQSLATL